MRVLHIFRTFFTNTIVEETLDWKFLAVTEPFSQIFNAYSSVYIARLAIHE